MDASYANANLLAGLTDLFFNTDSFVLIISKVTAV